MSDHRDNDNNKGKEQDKQYSVDEILEEYGSGKARSNVLDFPPPEKRPPPDLSREPERRPPGQNTIRFKLPEEGKAERPAAQGERRTGGSRVAPRTREAQRPGGVRTAQASPRTQDTRRPPEERPRPQPREPKKPEPEQEEIVEIVPESPLRRLGALLSVFDRRTDHYADHMYDQAEPGEAARRAEKYLPGVDREEQPQQGRRTRPRRRPRRMPPDAEPAELSKRYAKGLKGKKVRLVLAALCAVLCAAASLLDPETLRLAEVVPGVPPEFARQAALLGLLAVTGLLCAEVSFGGLAALFTLRPGPESMLSLSLLATLGDGAYLLVRGGREGLPCCAVAAVGLVLGMWGHWARRQGDRLSARAAAQAKAPFVVTVDEAKWSGRPAYAKWVGTQSGFGSQLQCEDGVHRAYLVAAPLLILACLICAGMSGARYGADRFLWTLSAALTAASAWGAALAYPLPYQRLARRLFDGGAALAGWPGISRCGRHGILMSDNDLFPGGTVRVSGVKVFGDLASEKVLSYTATLLRALNCGLSRPFQELVRAQGVFYREVSGVRFHEGGVTGIIRENEVFVGTADFMHLMDVELPQGLSVKHAVFCAINGELAGIFALKYSLGQTVRPCLSALMEAGVRPIVATRDPNLIPNFLREKYKLPVDRMEFPPVERRLELSDPAQDHDDAPVALLSREGIAPYCDAVVGGKRLRSAVYLGTAFSLLGSALGVAVTFYLTYLGAAASLTVPNFLLFMGAWLVPAALVERWVDRF